MMRSVVVSELWRYPVKSMGGERLDAAVLDARGVHADRLWAVRDLTLKTITTARRLPLLLGCSARFAAEPAPDAGPGAAPEVLVTFPDGSEVSSGDDLVHVRLSELVGRPVELRPLPPATDRASFRTPLPNAEDLRRQFAIADGEPLPDLSMFPLRKLAELSRYATPPGSFADAYPVHVLTTASLRALEAAAPGVDFDVRRFRPNVLVDTPDDGFAELAWCGGSVRAGAVDLRPAIPTIRCSMPVRTQPGLDAEPDVLRTLNVHAERCLGVYADVARGGRLAVGDAVAFTPPEHAGGGRREALRRRLIRAGSRMLP